MRKGTLHALVDAHLKPHAEVRPHPSVAVVVRVFTARWAEAGRDGFCGLMRQELS